MNERCRDGSTASGAQLLIAEGAAQHMQGLAGAQAATSTNTKTRSWCLLQWLARALSTYPCASVGVFAPLCRAGPGHATVEEAVALLPHGHPLTLGASLVMNFSLDPADEVKMIPQTEHRGIRTLEDIQRLSSEMLKRCRRTWTTS